MTSIKVQTSKEKSCDPQGTMNQEQEQTTESEDECSLEEPPTQPDIDNKKHEQGFLNSLRDHLNSYFDNTTVHGFKYILTGDSTLERLAWVATVVLAFTGAFILIDSYVREVVNNPITMSLSKIPVSEVAFPAVTVDSGQVVDHFGYVRKAMARKHVDESDKGNVNRFEKSNVLPADMVYI